MISDLFVCLLVAPAGQPLEKEEEDDVVVILFNNIHEKAPTWICRIRAIFLQLSLSLSLSCWGDVTDPLLQCGQLSLIYWMPTNNFAMLCESEILFFVGPFVYANSFPPLSLLECEWWNQLEINDRSVIFPPFQLTAPSPVPSRRTKKHFNGRVFYFGWNGQKRRTCAPKHSHTHTCINSPDPSVRVCGWVRRHTHK